MNTKERKRLKRITDACAREVKIHKFWAEQAARQRDRYHDELEARKNADRQAVAWATVNRKVDDYKILRASLDVDLLALELLNDVSQDAFVQNVARELVEKFSQAVGYRTIVKGRRCGQVRLTP